VEIEGEREQEEDGVGRVNGASKKRRKKKI
jgi:hypothetical protein